MSNEKAGSAASATRALQPAETNPLDFAPDTIPFDTPYGPPISLDRSQAVIHAGVAEAKKHNWRMNTAVVDCRSHTRLSGPTRIRILIVGDHSIFREGLGFVLAAQPDMIVVSQVATASEGIAEFRRHRPDVTLSDQTLPCTNGTDTLTVMRAKFPNACVVILTSSEGDIGIQRVLRAGAAACALKRTPTHELLELIRSVRKGRKYFPSEVARRLSEHLGEEDLTPRELDVLKLIRDGHRNKQIADVLSIAETTVNFHIRNIVSKLQANDRAHAVTIAIRRGALEL